MKIFLLKSFWEKLLKPNNIILLSGLITIIFSLVTQNSVIYALVILFPLLLIFSIFSFRYPVFLFILIFILNYYLLGLTRYIEASGVSYLMDGLMFVTLIMIIFHSLLYKNVEWKILRKNYLFWGMTVWMFYCILQLANPSAHIQAWITNRGLAFNGCIITLIASVLLIKRKHLDGILIIYSILTLTAVVKVLWQRYIGWDYAELRWLNNGGALTHLIMTGTRYFSFFSDAGNFGSNMGCAGIVFIISALFTKSKLKSIYYIAVGSGAFYAMMLSGTRGAMIVPLAGLALYTLLSKNFKLMALSGTMLVFIYIFFAFTMIGQGNQQIRRMRTAFRPTADASFNVRRENKKILAEYLKYKPFGEGIGLSGVENKKFSTRLTTMIPHDSTYVKIWVETGIVGVIFYLGILFFTISYCSYLLLFKIKDKELRGYLSALLCGIFGMLLSAYGNAFWGQFPTNIIAFVGLTLILNGERIEQDMNEKREENQSLYIN